MHDGRAEEHSTSGRREDCCQLRRSGPAGVGGCSDAACPDRSTASRKMKGTAMPRSVCSLRMGKGNTRRISLRNSRPSGSTQSLPASLEISAGRMRHHQLTYNASQAVSPFREGGYEQLSEVDDWSHPIRNTCRGARSTVVVTVGLSCPSVPTVR
jgi:hypothetical protein